jgi:hypothetical protein
MQVRYQSGRSEAGSDLVTFQRGPDGAVELEGVTLSSTASFRRRVRDQKGKRRSTGWARYFSVLNLRSV